MAGARDKAIAAVVTSDSGASLKDKAKEQEKKNIADGKDRGGDNKMDTDVSQGIYVTMTHNIAIQRIYIGTIVGSVALFHLYTLRINCNRTLYPTCN
jgi:hypothetical protein